jgi:perosamine synthetase
MIIRKAPRPALRYFLPRRKSRHPCNPHVISTYSGRYAIYQTLHALGLNSEDEILLPAYHCLAMLQPIITYGCRPTIYRIDNRLQTTVDQVMKGVSEHTRMVILVHHFGIYQRETENIARELAHLGIFLMEDCAHVVPFSRHKGGALGDVAVYSPWKFLPLLDGGILQFNNGNIYRKLDLCEPPLFLAIKNAKNILEREMALSGNRIFGKLYLYLDKTFRRGREFLSSMPRERITTDQVSFHNQYIKFKATSLSRWATYAADFEEIYHKRSQISCSLFEQTYQGGQFQPPQFLPGNESDCVFGFPILIHDRRQAVPFLKSRNIPHFTFGDKLHDEQLLEPDSAELRFSRNLLFVPLLQDFNPHEVAYLAANVRELLSRGL